MFPHHTGLARIGWGVLLVGLLGLATPGGAQDYGRSAYWQQTYGVLPPTAGSPAACAHRLFRRLLQVSGHRAKPEPRLLVLARDPDAWAPLLPITLPDGGIVLAKRALALCAPPTPAAAWGGEDRLAFVLAHELAHYYRDDAWHLRFFVHAAKAPPTPEVRALLQAFAGTESQQVLGNEFYADAQGLLTMLLAGFNPQAVVSLDDQVHFFADWLEAMQPRPTMAPLHPTPAARTQALKLHLRSLVAQAAVVQAGLWFMAVGDYPHALQAWQRAQAPETVGALRDSREVRHNLALSQHALALQAYQLRPPHTPPLPFMVPLVLDPVTWASHVALDRLTRRNTAPGPEALAAQFRDHLDQAIHGYRAVLKDAETYVPSALNLGAALLVRGVQFPTPERADWHKAVAILTEALPHAGPAEQAALHTTLGVVFWYLGDRDLTLTHLRQAQQGQPDALAPACTLARLAQRDPQLPPPGGSACPAPPPRVLAPPRHHAEAVGGLQIGQVETQLPPPWVARARQTFALDDGTWTLAAYAGGVQTLARNGEIGLIVVQEGYSQPNARGLVIGQATAAQVRQAYGPPPRQLTTTTGEVWSYETDHIAFQFRDGTVVAWIIY